jgi:hypothetical protein
MADKNNADPVGQDVDIYSLLKDIHMQKNKRIVRIIFGQVFLSKRSKLRNTRSVIRQDEYWFHGGRHVESIE